MENGFVYTVEQNFELFHNAKGMILNLPPVLVRHGMTDFDQAFDKSGAAKEVVPPKWTLHTGLTVSYNTHTAVQL